MDIKTGIVALACNENLYLRDWVRYHLSVGINYFLIMDNSPANGGNYPEAVLGDFIDMGIVEVFHFRKQHKNPPKLQAYLYTEAFNYAHSKADWLFFIDIDEFITFGSSEIKTVDEVLSRDYIKNAEQIRLNWLCYSDNNLLHYSNKPVWERFTEIAQPIDHPDWWGTMPVNYTIKSGINCNKTQKADFNITESPHFSITDNGENAVCVQPNGTRLNPKSSAAKFEYSTMFIRHYRTLTIEEFLIRRALERGNGEDAQGDKFNKDFFLKLFSCDNTMTDEKIAIADRIFEIAENRETVKKSDEFEEPSKEELIADIKSVFEGGNWKY